jgi:hypothetical protein
VERNALYKYDLGWRQNDYFNPGLLTAGGNSQHLIDTNLPDARPQPHDSARSPNTNSSLGIPAARNEDPLLPQSKDGPAFSF